MFLCSCYPSVSQGKQSYRIETGNIIKNTTESNQETKAETKRKTETVKTETIADSTIKNKTEKSTNSNNQKPVVKESNDIVIVLDAGHDSTTHTRNHANLFVNEQDLNLKIVKACYKKLIQYNGVTVYLTRKNGQCPNSRYHFETSALYGDDCIHARTQFAEEKSADIFISFHCNASTGELGASANGAEVYVSKHPAYYDESKRLGETILKNIINAVDLSSRGVLTRSKPEKGTYDNGTVKDFYYLISNNIDNKRPALIIEHAFMDNSHDNSVLRDDTNLKKLGEADAEAIAEHFGLSLK